MKNLAPIPANIPLATVDGTSTSTAYTATVPGIDSLFDGVCVLLKNGKVTSAAGFTVNINGLGAKPVYSNMAAATAETTVFNVNYTLLLVYDSTRVSGGCWVNYRGYYSDANSIGYQLRTNSSTLPASDAFVQYRILFTSADGKKWVPATTSTSTNATSSRAVNQRAIDPFGPIVYYSSTTAVSANANPGVTVLWEQYALTFGYSFNRTGAALTLSYPAPVYIKCAPQADGSAIIDSTTPYVQSLPTTEDGNIYIYLGRAYSATAVEMVVVHPIYEYKNGALRLYTNASAGVTSVNGQTGAVTLAIPTKLSDLTNDKNFKPVKAGDDTPVAGTPGSGEVQLAEGEIYLKFGSIPVATQSADGLMSAADKTKLDGFQAASNYALKSEISGAYRYKGSVATASQLPTSGNQAGDVWNIEAASTYGEAGTNVAWTGSAWDSLGSVWQITAITNAEIDAIVAA